MPVFSPSNPPVVLVLAGGRGERFAASGGSVHKLQALLAGKPVISHVLDAVRASGLPFHVVTAHASRPGMGDSIAAGVRATVNASGWMMLPADLPLVRPETLRLIALSPACAVTVPAYKGRQGHPVRFAACCAGELLNLKGNRGAAHILSGHAATDSIAFLTLQDIGIVTDIDTLQDLAAAEVLLAARQAADA